MRSVPALLCALVLSAGLAACGSSSDSQSADLDTGATAIAGGNSRLTLGVNSYLWHASLDTLAFLPLQSADPFGGVIISDWYVAPTSPDERLKVTVYIMDRRLRADGVKVSVFRQTRDAKSGWIDAATNVQTGEQIENAILVRARQLRMNSVEAGDTKTK